MAEKNRYKVEFDIPFEGLDFYGCPNKSVVKVRPTKNCMVAISEFPFFVIDLDDIELVYFERVTFGIKNFDMAIIFKDLTNYRRINSIPIEHIETIKNFLDEIKVIYAEGVVPMNWTNILNQIREDFEGFLDEGGWKFLFDNVNIKLTNHYFQGDEEGENDEDDSEQEDPEFDVESEAEGSESESDYSDDDDDYSDSDLDSEDDEDELSEEGMSWDEMEKQAEEDDRRAATRRVGPTKEVAQNKKRPMGRR